MKLTTIFRHYSKFQSQWKVNYFEQHCDWEQLPNRTPSSDFKAAKQQQKEQMERPAGCCSLFSKIMLTPTKKGRATCQPARWSQRTCEHKTSAHTCSSLLLQQLRQLCRSVGSEGRRRAPQGTPGPNIAQYQLGQLDPHQPLARPGGCWWCTDGAQGGDRRGKWLHSAGSLLPEAQPVLPRMRWLMYATLEENISYLHHC